jgi:NAD kinase
MVATFQFQKEDLVVTLGQDGLVANTAKYVGQQPIVAVNPEPERFDGILLPFLVDDARSAVARVIEAKSTIREITLAEIRLNDGQRLLGRLDPAEILVPQDCSIAEEMLAKRIVTAVGSSNNAVSDFRRAYPNYFLDTAAFIESVKQAMNASGSF